MRVWGRISILLGVVASLGVLGISCGDKSTPPEPVEYWLVATVADPPYDDSWLFVIDTEGDTVVDSLYFSSNAGAVNGSPDGKYVGVRNWPICTRLFTPPHLTLAGELDCYRFPIYIPEDNLIVAFDNHTVDHYDYRSFNSLGKDSIDIYKPQLVSDKRLICGINEFGRWDSTGFVFYDYRTRQLTGLRPRIYSPNGFPYHLRSFHVPPTGDRLYAISERYLFGYNFDRDSVIFEIPIYLPFGDVRVSPDGREVYFTDPGDLWDRGPGQIFIYDADNGGLLDKISLLDLDTTLNAPQPFYANEIRFHPTKPKAYVSTWGQKALGPILVIDTEKREIIKWIFDHFEFNLEHIDIMPKQ